MINTKMDSTTTILGSTNPVSSRFNQLNQIPSSNGYNPSSNHYDHIKRDYNLNGLINLNDILSSFHSSLSEEQIWSICHQSCLMFKEHFNCQNNKCYLIENQYLILSRDGIVHSDSTLKNEDGQRTLAQSESHLLSSLGICLYGALDYGLDDNEERQLTRELELLLLKLTSSLNDVDGEGEEGNDEGIQTDIELTFNCVLQMCKERISEDNAELHYKNVCRAIVHEAIELATFLAQVTNGEQVKEDDEQLQIAVSEWAKIWIQVVKELRCRTRTLRKVDVNGVGDGSSSHRKEFALTPFEMLLEDIRMKKYKLNKLSHSNVHDGSNGYDPLVHRKVKKDAHTMILDFIRSRPPLMPYKQRQNVRFLEKKDSMTLFDKLLHDIRSSDHLKRLKHIECKSEGATPIKRFNQSVQQHNGDEPDSLTSQTGQRKLIKVDLDLLSDDDDDILVAQSLPVNINDSEDDHNENDENSMDRKDERRFSLRNLKLKLKSLSKDGAKDVQEDDEESINCEEDTRNKLELIWNEDGNKWQNKSTVSLKLSEISAIRKALTKAEVESLSVTKSMKNELQSGKICFNCLKTRFSILSLNRSYKCSICERSICTRCITSMQIPSHKTFKNIPIYCLSPSPLSPTTNYTFLWSEGSSKKDSSSKIQVKGTQDDSAIDERKNGERVKVCRDCKLLVRHLVNNCWH